MGRNKPAEEVKMVALNVDIPQDIMQMLKVAKAVTDKPIREIAAEAFSQWMQTHGISREAVQKLRESSPSPRKPR